MSLYGFRIGKSSVSKRNLIVVDVEADGPCPGLYSIVCFGAVHVNSIMERRGGGLNASSFYGPCAPLSVTNKNTIQNSYVSEALAVSGISREEHEKFPDSFRTMVNFKVWLNKYERPVFVSDNPAFDWQFINYYFALYGIANPFGFSARRIGDFYAGLNLDWDDQNSWKKLRKTIHTHNPVDDALGNAEALLELFEYVEVQLANVWKPQV